MFKNVAAKVIVFAFDTTTNTAKTGDAANITGYVSKDYGAVTALTDTSATEMDATNAKGYYLIDITATEANADVLLISGKSSTANIAVIGAPAVIFTRPQTGWLAPTTAARTLTVDASGRALADVDTIKTNAVVNGGTVTFPTNATLASTTNITAAAGCAVSSIGNNVITAASINADAITAAKVAADVSAEIADAVWDEDATAHQTGGTFGQAIGDPAANTATIYDAVVTNAAGTDIAADIIAIKAQTAAIETDTAEIGVAGAGLTVLATAAALDAVDNFVDTEVAAIKAKTDQLTFTVANQVDSNIQSVNDVTVTGNGQAGTEWGP